MRAGLRNLPGVSRNVLFTITAAIAMFSVACGKRGSASTGATLPTTPPPAPDEPKGSPQPKLPTIQLFVGTNEITAEIARTPRQIETGMMWRTELGEMEGMLFVFPRPEQRSFWMKNCPLPMTCAYIAPDGKILETRDMIPHETRGIFSKTASVQFVLEMNRDWFKDHGVAPGAVIASEHGPLRETFFQR